MVVFHFFLFFFIFIFLFLIIVVIVVVAALLLACTRRAGRKACVVRGRRKGIIFLVYQKGKHCLGYNFGILDSQR